MPKGVEHQQDHDDNVRVIEATQQEA